MKTVTPLYARELCSVSWGINRTRKNTSSAVEGKNRVIKATRTAIHREILGSSAFRKPSLNPSGITIRQKIMRRLSVHTQSPRLGIVRKAFMMRVPIGRIGLHRAAMSLVYQKLCLILLLLCFPFELCLRPARKRIWRTKKVWTVDSYLDLSAHRA